MSDYQLIVITLLGCIAFNTLIIALGILYGGRHG